MKKSREIQIKKEVMRTAIRKRARSFCLPKDESAIAKKILLDKSLQEASSFFTYISYNKEVPTLKLIESLLAIGKEVYVPKIIKGHIQAVRIRGLSEIRTNSRGLKQPVNSDVFTGKINCSITPGQGFDKAKRRLGQGGGYYDKFFEVYKNANKETPYTIGMCWQWQVVPSVPTTSHDIRMDQIMVFPSS